MKTPMQEAIEKVQSLREIDAVINPIGVIETILTKMLEKEKEVLAGVWLDAQVAYQGDEYIKPSDPTFDEYYEKTFNTK